MSQPGEGNPASGLLHDLDDIRSLLEEPGADALADGEASIPVLADAIDIPDSAIPVLEDVLLPGEAPVQLIDDALSADPATLEADFSAFTRPPRWSDLPDALTEPATPVDQAAVAMEPLVGGDTLTERLVGQGLDAAIRARIDATLEHWVNETLQVELALLRARLQDAVKTEIEAFISQEIHRYTATGKTHGE